jgi:hypothetical protein
MCWREDLFVLWMQESRVELLQAFQQHPWLNMLHLHVGSQGLQLDTVIAGGRMQRLRFKALHNMRTYVCTR